MYSMQLVLTDEAFDLLVRVFIYNKFDRNLFFVTGINKLFSKFWSHEDTVHYVGQSPIITLLLNIF